MRQKCPNGYEVVHEDEAVVGQVEHTHTETETRPPPVLGVGGDPRAMARASRWHVRRLGVPLGKTEETTRQTTNYENVTEWRIYYRAKQPGPPGPVGQPPARLRRSSIVCPCLGITYAKNATCVLQRRNSLHFLCGLCVLLRPQ